MGKRYEDLMAELSAERRARVEGRTAELVSEEKSLRDLRHARQLTQQSMAKKLGVKQHSISRLEQRSDLLLSTLRDYVGKMGGELILTARFPDRDPVRITGFGDMGAPQKTSKSRTAAARARSSHARYARAKR